MNFGNQPVSQLISLTADGFIITTGMRYKSILKKQIKSLSLFNQILNTFGALSAKSQSLKQIITTSLKFNGSDQRIYIKINTKTNEVLGFVKTGEKNLFYRDYLGNIKQIRPTCVLDIYVHESYQRNGIGKEIFEKFLEAQKLKPEELAYDRPSPKLISFLRKHYNLSKFIPQNNNFVIFDDYFAKYQPQKRTTMPNIQFYNSFRKPFQHMGQQTNRKVTNTVTDSLSLLEKQIQNIKNGGTTAANRQKNSQTLAYRTPWAIKQGRDHFYTTSKQYGKYFQF